MKVKVVSSDEAVRHERVLNGVLADLKAGGMSIIRTESVCRANYNVTTMVYYDEQEVQDAAFLRAVKPVPDTVPAFGYRR